MNFYERVYELVRRIPAGKCASYGQLALMLGNPRASRAVGHAMRACRTPGVPCHRVVRADGSTTPAFGPGVQRAMLEAEGCPSPPTAGWSWAAAGGTVPDGFCLPFADGRDIISAY
ncbi:MAG: MGMT family protein [Flavonifractor plautii]